MQIIKLFLPYLTYTSAHVSLKQALKNIKEYYLYFLNNFSSSNSNF